MKTTREAVAGLCNDIERAAAGSAVAERAADIRGRLNGPLHVAIAGRVKAGKSTLLNALVGERLAATDAGECTRVVTWYRHGPSYKVRAALQSGDLVSVPFTRDNGELRLDLGAFDVNSIARVEVEWPAPTLRALTLIDTPGLASIDEARSRRTRAFLDHNDTESGEADAVIYLMRHLHRADAAFLDAFMDRSVTAASPTNTVAVLSRADEIGAGRLDALVSAGRIAERYATDPAVRRLVATVVPIAGLVAETGLTLREDEAQALRLLAAEPEDHIATALLSADHFLDVSRTALTAELRGPLVRRLGMFGLRVSLDALREGRASNAGELSQLLVEASGLADLRRLVIEHFVPRATVLQTRTALAQLRRLLPELRAADPPLAATVETETERIEACSLELALLRAAHLTTTGEANATQAERDEVAGSVGRSGSCTASDDVLAAVERWRTRAADPGANRSMIEVAETMARSYESAYVSLASARR